MRKQLEFQTLMRPKDWFGGSLLKGNPKTKRPLDSKLPTHLVLRAKKSVFRLPKNFEFTNKLVKDTAAKYGVRIYDYANVGNHLHILLKLPHRSAWAAFIRELTGKLAAAVGRGIWLHRPFTRVVRGWRRAYKVIKDYLNLNKLEAVGLVRRSASVGASEVGPLSALRSAPSGRRKSCR